MSYSSHYFVLKKFLDFFLTYLIILITSVSCDSETWRNRYTNKIHLSEVCTLTAKNFTHLRITFGLSITECINSFFVHFVIGSKILYNSSYYQTILMMQIYNIILKPPNFYTLFCYPEITFHTVVAHTGLFLTIPY